MASLFLNLAKPPTINLCVPQVTLPDGSIHHSSGQCPDKEVAAGSAASAAVRSLSSSSVATTETARPANGQFGSGHRGNKHQFVPLQVSRK